MMKKSIFILSMVGVLVYMPNAMGVISQAIKTPQQKVMITNDTKGLLKIIANQCTQDGCVYRAAKIQAVIKSTGRDSDTDLAPGMSREFQVPIDQFNYQVAARTTSRDVEYKCPVIKGQDKFEKLIFTFKKDRQILKGQLKKKIRCIKGQ